MNRKIPFGRPILGEAEKTAVRKVLEGDILVHGPIAKQFEAAFATYTGSKFAISTSSCTASLHLAYFDLGIKPGDEVIVPAMTHVATVHAVELCGGRPIFVDAEGATGNIDIGQIESKITSRTKALSLVHFLGMPVNMEAIMKVARKHSLFVVEDCALAIGARYKGQHVGTFGDVGCYSFYPVKHMTTAEGGMTLTQSQDIYDRTTRKKAFGVDRTMGEREVPGFYDVKLLGFNYRMNEIEAALGIEQLKSMPQFLTSRQDNFRQLESGLRDISEIELLESTSGDYLSSYYCLSFVLKKQFATQRLPLVRYLNSHGVGTSVYYPQPVPAFTYYQEKYREDVKQYPQASRIAYQSVALPVGPHLGLEDMNYIVATLKAAIVETRGQS